MLLLIDAGNTRIKWALAAADARLGGWAAGGAVSHAELGMLARHWGSAPVRAVLIANVAGAGTHAALLQQVAALRQTAAGSTRHDAPPVHWFASSAHAAGVRNAYRLPEQLGCDRLAALVGARALRPGQALVVAVCGTATTVDALTAEGEFIGGMILPGPGLMAASLARNTAQLPAVAALGHAPESSAGSAGAMRMFADNTDDAIASGCLNAQAGAIERAVKAHGGAHCLLSGGAAALVASRLTVAFTAVDNLVLVGLQVIAASRGIPCKGS